MLGTGQSRPQVLRARLLAAIGLALAIVLACPLAQAQTFTVLYTFTDETEGWQPDAAPILDTAGNLYGTTQYGGTEGGFGTVFELDTTGHERVLYSFAGEPDGEDPVTGLVGDHSGNLYGTTLYGGTAGGFGTVFKLGHTGKLTLLHSFGSDPDGADPRGSLIGDPQGNGYGTTQYGGAAGGYGAVFEQSANGQFTVLYSFSGTPDGENPEASLIRDSAGNLYGTTVYGGTAGGYGTVFKLDKDGKLTLLHSFAGTPDGENPYAGLAADSAGNGYGTTKYGGTAGGFGTVFKIDRTGKFSLVHSFAGTPDGENPLAGLVVDPAGNIYGTTYYGGTYGYGTVFEIDTTGKLTVLHNFDASPDGANPLGGLTRDAAGNLYGTTSDGGDLSCGFFGCGVVFEVAP
ncbi:MAG: choice-of-anchor tandem repeat GloVer-containing protein [Terriglobales bacterium]